MLPAPDQKMKLPLITLVVAAMIAVNICETDAFPGPEASAITFPDPLGEEDRGLMAKCNEIEDPVGFEECRRKAGNYPLKGSVSKDKNRLLQ